MTQTQLAVVHLVYMTTSRIKIIRPSVVHKGATMFNRSFPNRSRGFYLPVLRSFSILLIASMLMSPIGAFATPVAAISELPLTNLASIAPPWCGTPAPDGVGSLPDGTGPNDPPGSFPHIPVYAFACTLADIQARSNGRMETRVFGQSAGGKDLYLVTITALDTVQQRKEPRGD